MRYAFGVENFEAGGLIGHGGILRELAALAASDEPPHAILFAGPEGTGRSALALEYAKLLNCQIREQGTGNRERGTGLARALGEQGASLFGDEPPLGGATDGAVPCGVCRACRLIAEGTHPDVIRLSPGDMLCRPRDGESHAQHPDSRDIRICQIRGLIDLAARYPFEAAYRAIIIEPADRMNREASNTLLKTLEEPPGHTVMLLISAAPEAIIETVQSRCRRIDVRTVPRTEIEAGLAGRGIDPAIAAQASEAARGRPGRALAFAAEPELMGDRGRLLDRCSRLAAGTMSERFSYAGEVAERFRRDRSSIAIEFDAWDAFWEGRLRSTLGDADAGRGAIRALSAITLARADVQAQVIPRAALELMLLSFPRVTLVEALEEDTAAYA